MRSRLESWTNAVLHDALDAFDLPRGSGPEGQKVGAPAGLHSACSSGASRSQRTRRRSCGSALLGRLPV